MAKFYNTLMSNVIQIGDGFIPICNINHVRLGGCNGKYGVAVETEHDGYRDFSYETIEEARAAVKEVAMKVDSYYSNR